MNKKGKILVAILALLFVCLIVWVVKTTPDSPPEGKKFEPPTSMTYENNTIIEEVNGVRLWDVTAEKMNADFLTQNADMENVTAHFYKENGDSIELTADHGLYENVTKDIHVEGNVVVTTTEGAKLTSGKMDWFNENGVLVATDKVKITKDDMLAEGDRIESKDGFSKFLLKGHAHIVKGIKNSEEPPKLDVDKYKNTSKPVNK